MPDQELLPPFPTEGVQRVLCVVAHPDDIEYGAAAAVAAWTAQGIDVSYLLLTRGEAGIDTVHPDAAGDLREREQRAAAAIVGVSDVEFLSYPDGVLTWSLEMRRDIARVVRRKRPNVVVTGTWAEDLPWGLNQADHRAVGLATADAVRDAANRWVFTDLIDEGLEPWSSTWLLVSADPQPTHGVDVTGEPFELGVAALEAHEGYFAALDWHPPVRDLLTELAQGWGPAMGVKQAALFRAHEL